jgi:hypothetical protein
MLLRAEGVTRRVAGRLRFEGGTLDVRAGGARPAAARA